MDRAAGLSLDGAPGPRALERPPRASAEAYQRRRDVNVERLNRLAALIASSTRSAEIYRGLGVLDPPVERIALNAPHLERVRPKANRRPREPLRFAVLNACNSTQKGADLVVATLNDLSRRGLDDRYRLLVFGSVAPHVIQALAAHPAVELRGDYRTDELDRLLDEADVGLFPSVWEEVYGFVALEFLAKGIPVIGNAVGAIPEHVRPGQTGWLNRSCTAQELADLMQEAVENPGEVERLSASATALRHELIEPFPIALAKLSAVYERVTGS